MISVIQKEQKLKLERQKNDTHIPHTWKWCVVLLLPEVPDAVKIGWAR